ncbi:MAG TPA: alpha/beta hydrolase, partial [Rhodospirillaceae bacterium]|nr:alpha/beta hydrolase [Rhodospirillaceae bacterium]
MRWLLCLCGLIALSACSGSYREQADSLASPSGFNRRLIRTSSFVLTTYAKITHPNQPARIYIEGDGLAWVTPDEPSLNPTPPDAFTLRLTLLDPSPNVIYIARP